MFHQTTQKIKWMEDVLTISVHSLLNMYKIKHHIDYKNLFVNTMCSVFNVATAIQLPPQQV